MKNPRCPKCSSYRIEIVIRETRSYELENIDLDNGDIDLNKEFSSKITDEGLSEIRCASCGTWWESIDGFIASIKENIIRAGYGTLTGKGAMS